MNPSVMITDVVLRNRIYNPLTDGPVLAIMHGPEAAGTYLPGG